MRIKSVIRISGLIGSVAFSSTLPAQSLQEAIQKTINENPEIQSKKAERVAVEQQIKQAKAGYFPTVDVSAGIGWEQSSNPTTRAKGDGTVSYGREEASIQLHQMVFDGMATSSEVKRHKARTNSRAFSLFGKSEIKALDAVQAYVDVLRRKELVGLAKENLLFHLRTHDQISLRSERGIGKGVDVDQSSGRLALAEKNTLSEEGNLKNAETAFLRVIGDLPVDLEQVQPVGDGLPESIAAATEQAIANHPILKSANADIDSAFAQHATAKAPYMPRLDIEAGASHNVDLDGIKGKNEDTYAMLRLKYNLFNGGKDVARRKETTALIYQAKEIRDNTYRQVVESMRLSWVANETLKSQMDFFKKHKHASIKSNKAYQKQFNIGQRTLLDLLDSANEMYVSKTAYTNAKYDELFSQFRILASKGSLNNYLGITLPEEAKSLDVANK
ncbi:MAG: TolC family outer membrane protein [Methylococcales bacterium]|nr:TolC family outer membrane protein [Methylococcales bacterium]